MRSQGLEKSSFGGFFTEKEGERRRGWIGRGWAFLPDERRRRFPFGLIIVAHDIKLKIIAQHRMRENGPKYQCGRWSPISCGSRFVTAFRTRLVCANHVRLDLELLASQNGIYHRSTHPQARIPREIRDSLPHFLIRRVHITHFLQNENTSEDTSEIGARGGQSFQKNIARFLNADRKIFLTYVARN